MTEPLCPICKVSPPSADSKVRPFCSPRCKDIDLHNWLSGTYRIPDRVTPLDDTQADSPRDDEDESA
ncbi:MAG: DNA gyrase inhibitor YacG [Deltaproteobacteria bacterium]|nr:DNA gyrase inhibitor YacG [Deltaproteobacteria bacterium]